MPEAETQPQIQISHVTFSNDLQNHLKYVYFCLSTVAASTALGCGLFFDGSFQYGYASSVITLSLIIALHFIPDNGKNFWIRYSIIVVFGFCAGQLLGPLVQFVSFIDPGLLVSSLVGTAVVFLSLTMTAIFSTSGKYLFLGRVLTYVCNSMTILTLINLIVKSYNVKYMQLHIGAAIMGAFVLYDTQLVIEKFRSGDHDCINHSLDLFFDLVNMLRKVLVLLAERRKVIEL